jgi:hypothetical protein
MSYLETFESKMANPSWCLDVMMMYFIPASLAIRAHSSALKRVGLKAWTYASYSGIGTRARLMIHSPIPATRSPLWVPAGTA